MFTINMRKLVPGIFVVEFINHIFPFFTLRFSSSCSSTLSTANVAKDCWPLSMRRGAGKWKMSRKSQREAGGAEGEQGAGTPLSGLHQSRFAGRRQRHNRPVLLIFSPTFSRRLWSFVCRLLRLPVLGSKFRLPLWKVLWSLFIFKIFNSVHRFFCPHSDLWPQQCVSLAA